MFVVCVCFGVNCVLVGVNCLFSCGCLGWIMFAMIVCVVALFFCVLLLGGVLRVGLTVVFFVFVLLL